MPIINADGCPIYVEVEGPQRAPVLMLSNSLGTTLHMWDRQVAPFTQHFRLVRYDRRSHGRSGVPKGPYTMERLGRDVLAVLDALGLNRISWCGLSMGGMVGQWLGANAPERVERLVLTNTSSYFADKSAWNDRLKLVREKGIPAFAPANMERWFTKGFRERSPDAVAFCSRCSPRRRSKAISPAARRCATWTTASCCRRSKRPPSSSPPSTIRRRHLRRTSTSRTTSRARGSRCSTPRIFPMSSRRRLTPMRCWDSCAPGISNQ